MSPGTSPGYRARVFPSSTSTVSGTIPNQAPNSTVPTGKSRRDPGSSALSTVLLVLFVVLLIAVGASLILSRWPEILEPKPADTPLAGPPPIASPTVISVENRCPAGCVDYAIVAAPLVVQPPIMIITYPIVYEQVVPYIWPYDARFGYEYTRYAPIEYREPAFYPPSVYLVRPGDTVFGIARWFGVDPYAIVQANGLWNPNYIQVGQILSIPNTPARWHGYQ